jgi:uncharacterized protein (DUF885 family)
METTFARLLLSLAGIAGVLSVLVAASQATAGDAADAALDDFFHTFLEQSLRDRPLDATRLGDHRYDNKLEDLSAESRAKWTERDRTALTELPKKVNYKQLSRSRQIDYEILEHDLKRSLWLTEHFNAYETDPRIYNEYISDSIFLLLTQSTLEKRTNLANAAERMAYIPRIVAAAKANLKNPPRVYVETAIKQNSGSIAFYESGIYEASGDSAASSQLKEPAAKVIETLKDYQKFLQEDLLPRANGEWRIGKENFAKKLELELDAGLTAEQVLQDAEADFVRVEREMYVIARQLWSRTCPGKPLPPDDSDGRRATIQQVLAELNKNHGKPENLVKDVKNTVAQIRTFIAEKDILRLPDPDRCAILEMPEFQRGNSTAYLNQAPPLDPKAASVYAVSPPPKDWDTRKVESYLQEYNSNMIQILTIHEAYPGHYVQLDYSNRHPSQIRRVLFSGVFAEGWAVYCEQMMLDQGYGNGDLALRLNQLKWYLRTVANAILDHKMHCTKMTDEEALAFLTQRAYQSEGEALGKIIRSKQSSCQLSTYFVGRMAFYRLRQEIQREQGDKFDLGRYHEAVLEHGTLPVKYLPELVRERLKKAR